MENNDYYRTIDISELRELLVKEDIISSINYKQKVILEKFLGFKLMEKEVMVLGLIFLSSFGDSIEYIIKLKDEYFIVKLGRGYGNRYLCDQLDGLIKCIQDYRK